MSKEIWLSGKRGKGKYALVDDDDYERLRKYKWYLDGTGYARTYFREKNKQSSQSIHRMIMNYHEAKLVIDHKNRNKLDNQKSNLQIVSGAINSFNSKKRKSDKINIRSKFKGVSHVGRNIKRPWRSYISINRISKSLNRYETELDAALCYDKFMRENYPNVASLNFPEKLQYEEKHKVKIIPKTSSQYIGVSFHKRNKVWQAYITINQKRHYIGEYDNELEAAKARDKYLKEHLTEFKGYIKYNFQ
jgi:hypothetical protein